MDTSCLYLGSSWLTMNVHSKGDHPQPTPFTVAFAGFVSAHLQSTYCLRVNRGKPMQSSGWPSTFHHPFHLPEERQTPVDMADKDSSFSSLLTAIRSQSLTVRGSTSASQCSLWCNPSPPPPHLSSAATSSTYRTVLTCTGGAMALSILCTRMQAVTSLPSFLVLHSQFL